MSFLKKEKEVPPSVIETEVDGAEVGTAADVEEVMKKYDRESNVREWEGVPKIIVRGIFILFSFFCMYLTLFNKGQAEFRLCTFLGGIIIIGFLNFPIKKGNVKVNSLPWYDIIIMIAGSAPFFYFAVNASKINMMDFAKVSNDPMLLTLAAVSYTHL